MGRKSKHSSLLAKYSLMYEKKPRSRVFAPLAEAYRKIGMIDEALKILKEGIKNHPSYTLGYIVLGNCYYDMQNYEMAYSTIRPFVEKNLENISLQKLFAKTCINLSHLEEALQTFKYLLLLNPKDESVAEQIKLLEDDLLVNEEEPENLYVEPESFNEDEWVQVSFNNKEQSEERQNTAEVQDADQWNVEKISPLDKFKSEINAQSISVKEHNLDDQFYHEEYDIDAKEIIEPERVENKKAETEKPIITHTLVDLYCKQNHFDKAIEILENILEIHPKDKLTIEKLNSIKNRNNEAETKNSGDEQYKNIEIAYAKFQELINVRAQLV